MTVILHTETIGSGEPLVILHTGLQTGKTDFQAQKEKFKQSYRVILPDLRGHGSSISNEIGRASCREREWMCIVDAGGIRYRNVTGVQTCALPIYFSEKGK